MKCLIIVLFAALFGAEVCALNCYECFSITSNNGEGLNLPETQTGYASCNGQLEIMDCSLAGGCSEAAYNYQYYVQGYGRVSIDVLQRTCGAALYDVDQCLSGKDLQLVLNIQRTILDAVLPSSVTFLSGSADYCTCDDNLCNGHTMTVKPALPRLVSRLTPRLTSGTSSGTTSATFSNSSPVRKGSFAVFPFSNSSPVRKGSFAVLLSFLFSYVATKW